MANMHECPAVYAFKYVFKNPSEPGQAVVSIYVLFFLIIYGFFPLPSRPLGVVHKGIDYLFRYLIV